MGLMARHELQVKFTGEQAAETALNSIIQYIKDHDGKDIDFDLGKETRRDIQLDSLDNVMKILFAQEQGGGVRMKNSKGYRVYSNTFHSSYGWVRVMTDILSIMAPYLEDGSLYRYNDRSQQMKEKYVISGGKMSDNIEPIEL